MPAFLEDISGFYGTVERNEAGQTLEEFLEAYDPNKYQNPSVTVDTIVIRHPKQVETVEQRLQLLLIRRGNHPSIGKWALPGGFVNLREDTMDAAKRELEEETGLSGLPVEQLRAWGEYRRDPRTRIVTVAYLALIEDSMEAKAGDDASDAAFFDVDFHIQSRTREDDRQTTVYELKLTRTDADLTLYAEVEVKENIHSLLKEPTYRVIREDGLACDHPAIITQALLHLAQRIEEQK